MSELMLNGESMLPKEIERCLGQYSFTVNEKPIFASCQHKNTCLRFRYRHDIGTSFYSMMCKDHTYKFFMEAKNACDRSS